jgi:hypothetical protein
MVLYDRKEKPIAEFVISDVEDFIAGLRNPPMLESE